MEIIVNRCYGGFGISDKAFQWLIDNKKWSTTKFDSDGYPIDKLAKIVEWNKEDITIFGKYSFNDFTSQYRIDKDLIECVKKLKEEANGKCAKLEIINIPDDVEWEIDEYDGIESVHEKHRSW